MSETPYAPAEPPADGDRPVTAPPRFSASASVPVPQAQPPAGPPAPASFSGGTYGSVPAPAPYGQGGGTYGAPPAPALGQPFGQPPVGQPPVGQPPVGQPPVGQPPVGQPPVGSAPMGSAPLGNPPASGSARIAGSASVPGPTPYGAPPAPPSYGPPPSFGQPPAGPGYGSAPGGFGGAPTSFGQPSAPPAPYGQPPAGGGFDAPRWDGGGYGGPPTQSFGGYEPDYDRQVPSAPMPTQRRPRRGLIIGLIVVVVLAVLGIGAFVGISLLTKGGTQFEVGQCVQPQGAGAAVVDCSTPGAYKVVSSVNNQNDCTDATQPWIEVPNATGGKSYRCLEPANPAAAQPTASHT